MAKQQDQIEILRFPENVRQRHGMYINSPTHMIDEIIENSIDQFVAGNCTCIGVAINGDTITVQDDGAGIPVTMSNDPEHQGETQVEVAMTTLHAGGKFEAAQKRVKTGGLNGIGASAVNALSSYFQVMVQMGKKNYVTKFEEGRVTEHTHLSDEDNPDESGSGTTVIFVPDPKIWKGQKPDLKRVQRRVQQLAYLNPGLMMYLYIDSTDEENNPVSVKKTYNYPEGLTAYIENLTKGKVPLIEPVLIEETKDGGDDVGSIGISAAFIYTDSYTSSILGFVNNIYQEYGGDHETGFKAGIATAIRRYATDNKLIKDGKQITAEDTREGLTAVLHIKVANPNYEGQGKDNLHMPEVRTAVRQAVEEYFYDYLSKDNKRAKVIIDKCLKAARVREAAKKAREAARGVKELTSSRGLPGKLADCSSKKPEECEIFLVEGDSAAGSAKKARDPKHQAILPVFGKILNVEKATFDKVVSSEKLGDIAKALRCGIGKDFDIKKLAYHKIVIMADADSDGGHIQCLHMTNLYRYMKPLIEAGYVYAACPPLFRVSKGKGKKEQVTYLYSNKELADFDTKGCVVSRFKGLGEMDSQQLWETTMDPEHRHLIQITIDDIEDTEETLAVCMGKDTEARREFIFNHAADSFGENAEALDEQAVLEAEENKAEN